MHCDWMLLLVFNTKITVERFPSTYISHHPAVESDWV